MQYGFEVEEKDWIHKEELNISKLISFSLAHPETAYKKNWPANSLNENY
jgi:hypothetical protein